MTPDWVNELIQNHRDGALEEYMQQLWRTLRKNGLTRQDRLRVLRELEQLNLGGRKALYDMYPPD